MRQITQWGPLVAKRDKATGRVIKADGTVAAKGEVVPLRQQYLVPDTKRAGQSWQRFVRILRALGYRVEWKLLCAADYGAPTTRERLFLVARRDALPIVWPEPTHYKQPARGQQRWRSAAECIDWSIPGRSIFNRAKPLAENTLKRIAKGITKFVLENPEPFVVGINSGRPLIALQMDAAHGEGRGTTRRRGCGSHGMRQPLGTITASGGHALVCAWMMQANGGYYDISNATGGRSMRAPLSTITNSGSQQQLLSAQLLRQPGNRINIHNADDVMRDAFGEKTDWAGEPSEALDAVTQALRVTAFLINYYGTAAREPVPLIDTLTTKERLARVTVQLNGIPYYITDITLRMLEPSELYRAQGFPDDYIFTHGHDDRVFSRAAQIRMCGNSVSPPPAAALLRANYDRSQEQVLRWAS